MPVHLRYFVLLYSLAVNEVIANNDDCILSDIPAGGPNGICIFSNSGITADCSGKDLIGLPSDLSSDLMSIKLKNNKISCVASNFFERFNDLKTLIVNNNNIRKSFRLPISMQFFGITDNQLEDVDNFFTHCNNLKTVYLDGNAIKNIKEDVFQRCSKLKELHLSRNYLTKIWNRSFAGLTSLRTLVIEGNREPLQMCEESLTGVCDTLESLTISSNNIVDLPSTLLRKCTRLDSLDLYNDGLTALPSDLFRGLQLTKLDVSMNDLIEIPEKLFYKLDVFYTLIMSSIKLRTIPERLFENTSVNMMLDIGNNDLTEIPSTLFSLNPKGHFMSELFLCGNSLTVIPKGLFDNLPYLVALYLHGNNLKTLPGSLLAGTKLEHLFIFQNNIHKLTEPLFGIAKENSTLVEILMQDNPLRQLSSAVLDEVVDGGSITLSCERLTLPAIREQLNVTCLTPSTPMVMNLGNYAAHWFESRGFSCTATGVDNLRQCKSCSSGTYGARTAKGVCTNCPKGGFYQDQVGQYSSDGISINCKTCNPGTFVKEGSGDSPLSCKVCPIGTNKNHSAGFRACVCLEKYFRRDRFGKCEPCSPDGVKCTNDYMTIIPNYYWNWSYTNIDDYKLFVVNLQTFNDSYDTNTITFKGSLPKIHKCFKSGRCLNDVDRIVGNCAEGYTGWMCTACKETFFPIFGFCRHCPKFSIFILEFSLSIIVVCIFLGLIFKSYHKQSRRSRSLVDSTLALGKIVLGFYQIMGEFWKSIDVIFWPKLFKNIAEWLDFLQFNISSIMIKPSCFYSVLQLTPYTAFTLGSIFPYFAMVCAMFAVAVVKLHAIVSAKRKKANADDINSRLRRYQNYILTFLVLMLFVTYTSTCNVTFALYGPTCDMYYLDESDVHNISILRSDYSINCLTTKHHRFQIASYCSSIYVIALPVGLFVLLWKYSPRHPAGELRESDDKHNSPTWLRFLNENYKGNFWFWEIIELVRKVSQTFVIVLFGWKSYFAITVTLTLAVIFLILHISFKPMKDKTEYYLQLASLWAIFFNMLVAAVPAPESFSGNLSVDIMVTFLITLNISVVGIAFAVTFLKIGRIMCRGDCFQRGRNLFRTNQRQDELNHEEVLPLMN